MTIWRVEDRNSIAHFCEGSQDTLIWSYMQGCMGMAFTDNLTDPKSAAIYLADFCFLAGEPNSELVEFKPSELTSEYVVMVPPTEEWEQIIEEVYQEKAHRSMRYATRKDKTVFDIDKLTKIVERLPVGCELRPIDHKLYQEILSLPWAHDLCGNFSSYDEFAENALGVVILSDGELVSGASSYSYYRGGIEVQIDTREDYRRRGLASICGAKLILECLGRGLYPSWDAYTKVSLALAEKLGYVFDREYTSYEIYPWTRRS